MNKLHTLATAAVLLLAASASSFAASRQPDDPERDALRGGQVSSRATHAYGAPVGSVYRVAPTTERGMNAPYADRPYGAPDGW